MEYVQAGYDLTLRQLYYQMIARDLLPVSWVDESYNAANRLPLDTKNTQKNYKRLGEYVKDGRLSGLIDWNHIVDRGRRLSKLSEWDNPADLIRGAARSYRIDKWADQPNRVEVLIEKDALLGVLQRACNPLQVPFISCRGYTSTTAAWDTAQRAEYYADLDQTLVIVHLGDHDPSGIDASNDIRKRMDLFAGGVEVRRIALNMDQVQRYNPPPDPAKLTDSRCAAYIHEYGPYSWELDALEPQVLVRLITETVESLRDDERWNAMCEREEAERAPLTAAAERWANVAEFLRPGYRG